MTCVYCGPSLTCDLGDSLQRGHGEGEDDALTGAHPHQALADQQAAHTHLTCDGQHTRVSAATQRRYRAVLVTLHRLTRSSGSDPPAVRWLVRAEMFTSCSCSRVSVWNRWMEEPWLKAIHTPPPERTMWLTLKPGSEWASKLYSTDTDGLRVRATENRDGHDRCWKACVGHEDRTGPVRQTRRS